MEHEEYMREALALARLSGDEGEVPVGCVIVSGGKIIARGRNRREAKQSALSHAEIEAISEACHALGSWRLSGCSLYVTLEPCSMCAGAIINARIGKVFFGARDRAAGACGGIINIFEENFGHHPQLVGGILEKESSELLQLFFRSLR